VAWARFCKRKEKEENEKEDEKKGKEWEGRMGREGNGKGSLFQGLKRSVLRDILHYILHVYAVCCSELLQDATAK
jgi:hypothetical protein